MLHPCTADTANGNAEPSSRRPLSSTPVTIVPSFVRTRCMLEHRAVRRLTPSLSFVIVGVRLCGEAGLCGGSIPSVSIGLTLTG